MNPAELELHYPPHPIPAPGEAVPLAPGIFWLRMPLPFALDHINLWLFDDEMDGVRGWTLVDAGASTEPTRAAWEALFDGALAGRPLLRVIVTHFHPDHFGLAGWLCEGAGAGRWRAPLWMTATEYSTGRMLSMLGHVARDAGRDGDGGFLQANGLSPAQAQQRLAARGDRYYVKLVPSVPRSFHRLRAGDFIDIGPAGARRRFQVHVGRGHAPEHAMLACVPERLLVSGDIVLPRISTNVGVYEVEPDDNPLAEYLDSLARLESLPADTLVLPSHGRPFHGLQLRIAQQQAHHAQRLAEVRAACAQPRSAAEIVPVLFPRELDDHQAGFAFGESLAHLHALWARGELVRERGADGVLRFHAP